MGRERDACDTCSRNCWLKHKKKYCDPPTGSAFFKIMFGKKFSAVLNLPPSISKKVKTQVGKKFALENSERRTWDVQLSYVEGTLAFKKGWHNFVLDHGIELGDLLVFHYFSDLHFLVQIFGKSGCEKVSTRGRTDRSWTAETTKSSIPRKRPSEFLHEKSALRKRFHSCTFSESSIDVTPRPRNVETMEEEEPPAQPRTDPSQEFTNDRPKVAPVTESLGEPCFLSNRDTNYVVEDDRNRLFDLSTFEMPEKNAAVDRKEKRDCLSDLPTFDFHESEIDANGNHELHLQRDTYREVSNTFQNAEIGMPARKPIIEDERDYLRDLSTFDIPEYATEVNETSELNVQGDSREVSNTSQNAESGTPNRKTTSIGEEERDYLQDLPTFDVPENAAEVDETSKLMQGNTRSPVSDTFQKAEPCMSDRKPIIDKGEELDCMFDVPISEMHLNDYAIESGKDHFDGNVFCQASDEFQKAETGAAPSDFQDSFVPERNSEVLPDNVEVGLASHASCSPSADLPLHSITREPETSEHSSPSGEKATLNNEEARVFKEEPVANAVTDTSPGARIPSDEWTYGDLGEKATPINEEARVFKQEPVANVVTDTSPGAGIPSDERTYGDLGEKATPINEEARVFKQEPVGNGVTDAFPGACILTGEQIYGDLGEETKPTNQEATVFKQELCGNAEAYSSLSSSFSTSGQTSGDIGNVSLPAMDVEGGNKNPIKQEAMELMPDSCLGGNFTINEQTRNYGVQDFSENFNPPVENEPNVNIVIKPEPVDYGAPSTIAVQVRDDKNFLELPEPLPVKPLGGKKIRNKLGQQLVLLQDPAARLWPVIYHQKNGFKVLTRGWKEVMQANNIQPGDKCLFMVENLEESLFTLNVIHN